MNIRIPIAYFGSIGYYQKYVDATSVCLEVNEHYTKQTLRNRMYILGPNGIQQLSIPVKKINGSKTAVKDIQISYQEDWVKLHLKSLEAAYASSPFFDYYLLDLNAIYSKKYLSLVEFNLAINQFICEALSLTMNFSLSETFDLNPSEIDLRNLVEEPTQIVDYSYQQVFDKNDIFEGNLSILDALFNLGPMARKLLIP